MWILRIWGICEWLQIAQFVVCFSMTIPSISAQKTRCNATQRNAGPGKLIPVQLRKISPSPNDDIKKLVSIYQIRSRSTSTSLNLATLKERRHMNRKTDFDPPRRDGPISVNRFSGDVSAGIACLHKHEVMQLFSLPLQKSGWRLKTTAQALFNWTIICTTVHLMDLLKEEIVVRI